MAPPAGAMWHEAVAPQPQGNRPCHSTNKLAGTTLCTKQEQTQGPVAQYPSDRCSLPVSVSSDLGRRPCRHPQTPEGWPRVLRLRTAVRGWPRMVLVLVVSPPPPFYLQRDWLLAATPHVEGILLAGLGQVPHFHLNKKIK